MKQNPEIQEILRIILLQIEQAKRPATETILDDVDVRNMLKLSKRTLASWRENRIIPYTKVTGKVFYRLSDVLDLMKKNEIPALDQSLKIK